MIIEFQVSVSAFLAAQLTNLQSQQICSPAPFSVGGFQIIVDHIAFGVNSIRHSVPVTTYIFFEQAVFGTESQAVNGLQVQLAQDVTVFLADQNDILAHPNQPPSATIPVQGTIVVNLNYFASATNDCFLTFSFDHLELGALPPLPPGIDPQTIQQQAQSLAQSLVPSQTIPFNLIQTVLGSGARVENAGMSVDGNTSRIAFRAESPTASSFTPEVWHAFLNGNVPDRLQGADWGFFLDHNVISGVVALPIQQSLESSGSPQFQLVTGIGAAYSNPAPDRAHVQVTFSGNVDAKICTVWTDISIDNDITVSAPNTLTVDMNLSWNTETTVCTVTAALLGAILGGLVDLVIPFVAGIINPITGFLGGIATVLYLKNTLGPPSKQLPNCTQISDSHFVCSQRMAVSQASQFGKLGFTSLAALSDGVSLLGQLQPAPLTAAVVQPSFTQFSLVPPIVSCGEISGNEVANFLKDPTKFVSAEASVTLDNGGSAPLFLCNVAVQNDPLGVFQNAVNVTNSQSPIQIVIASPYPSPAYFANPYPCELLVSTNGGVRLVSIPPVQALTQQEINNFADFIALQVGDCAKLVDPWFNLFHRFNPVWLVDPPPDSVVDHSWDFVVNGLQPGETASLVDTAGQTLVVAVAQAGTPVRVNALVTPAAAGVVEVGLIHGAVGGGVQGASGIAPAPQRGIGVIERLMVRRSVIALGRPAARIGSCRTGQSACTYVVIEDGIELYDLSVSSQPRLGGAWNFPARGAISTRDGLLGFGDDGFVRLFPNGIRREPAECCEARRIIDATAGLGLIYALGNDALQVYSLYLRLLGSLPLAGAARLARVGNRLFIACSNGLAVFSLVNPEEPQLIDHSQTLPLIDLTVPADSGGRTLLAVPRNAPARLFDISSDGSPKPIADYPLTPWFLDTARLPGLLLRLVDGRTTVTVSEFGKTKKS